MSKLKFNKESYCKHYWSYFCQLEEQLLETRKYVEFDSKCDNAYSMEYFKLYQAVCSEIDVIGKELASALDKTFKSNKDTNIKNWGYVIQQKVPTIQDQCVCFNDTLIRQPFKRWEYTENITVDKNGTPRKNLKLRYENVIPWWKTYNAIKHQRVGLAANENNYYRANQKNLISSFCALYILESLVAEMVGCSKGLSESKCFRIIEREEEKE